MWLESEYIDNVQESTLNKTMRVFKNHIIPSFDGMNIREIKPDHCQSQLNKWRDKLIKHSISMFCEVYRVLNLIRSIDKEFLYMLGLPRGKVFLVPWTSEWEKEFISEKERIQHQIGLYTVEIHHIGSTAVEHLSSKPIINIAIELEQFDDGNGL